MRADLHIHTYYSDGKYPPEELARRAKAAGLSLISLTDHDSLAGLHEKRAAAEGEGLSFVSGWEVSAYEGEAKVHVLGYGCLPDAAYEDFLEERRRSALARAEDMIRKGNACFSLHLTLADAERFHLKKEAPLHTMHVVSAFSQKLGVKRGALYLSAFSAGKPCCSDIGRPTPFDALRVIHAAGGIASLAHPGRIPLPEQEKFALIDALVAAGLDGIECVHSDHTCDEAEKFARYAAAHGLLVTGGSDYHAEGRNREIGLPPFTPSEALLAAFSRLGGGMGR